MSTLLKRLRSAVVVAVALVVMGPTAQAVEGVQKYQVDVIALGTSFGLPTVNESDSRAIIEKINTGMDDSTGGLLKFSFRKLYDPLTSNLSILSSTDVAQVTSIKPEPDPGFDGAILIGVISKNSALKFAGMAGGKYMLINGDWSTANAGTVTHEFGHNLDLMHANSAVCTVVLPIVCEQSEYGDYSSVMGSYIYAQSAQPYIARFSITELDYLKVLPISKRAIAVESGTYKLAPAYSNNLDLPKVLYIPIGGQNVYSVEYRPAVDKEAALLLEKIPTIVGNGYHINTPSHGLQLRILNTADNLYPKILPIMRNHKDFSTALISDSLKGPQVQPVGKSFLLSDGSTVTFVSQDSQSGAEVKIVRPKDTEAPKFLPLSAEWSGTKWFVGPSGERLVLRDEDGKWLFPEIEQKFSDAGDDLMIKSLQFEVNGEIVQTIDELAKTTAKSFIYRPETVGKFSLRLIATDYAGNSAASKPYILTTGFDTSGKYGDLGCTNSLCYVGIPWNVSIGNWSAGTGNLSLQEKIGGKWKNIKVVKPIASGEAKFPNTYQISLTYTKPGRHVYRFYIAATKKYSAYIGKSFTQIVKAK